jgi:hypothetical protein
MPLAYTSGMKNMILCCLACISLISLAACSDTDKTVSTSNQSASMQTDTKDMKPVQH